MVTARTSNNRPGGCGAGGNKQSTTKDAKYTKGKTAVEGNPIVAVIMLCTMVCLSIWPLFALGLVAAGALAYFHQWIAAALIGVPSLWVVGVYFVCVVPYINEP